MKVDTFVCVNCGYRSSSGFSLYDHMKICGVSVPKVQRKKLRVSKWMLEQDEDCCGRANDDIQTLEIELHDGGGGAYAVIKTERWAADPDDLRELATEIELRVKEMDAAS